MIKPSLLFLFILAGSTLAAFKADATEDKALDMTIENIEIGIGIYDEYFSAKANTRQSDIPHR